LSATIRSRCRRLRFGVLSEPDVATVLTTAAGIDPPTARRLAAASGGSVARALAEQSGHFDDDREAALALLAASRGGAVVARLKAASAFAQHKSDRRDREAMSDRLAVVASLLRDLSVLASGATAGLANQDLADALADLGPAFDLARTSQAFGLTERAAQHLERNASPKIVADWLAVTL